MNTLFYIKAGNLLPALRATLYAGDGTPQSLAGATVRLHVHRPDGSQLFDRAVSAIEDVDGGIVRYDWQVGDTAVPGRYTAELEATIGGKTGTWPNDRNLVIDVSPSMGDVALQATAAALALTISDPVIIQT